MIADRLEVRTRPGGANEADRAPRDITISGPGSLFWLRRGTLAHQGTEVTLYLKPRFRLQHDPEALEPGLKRYFGYPKGEGYRPDAGVIDPPFIAACHVVWPRHPIDVLVPDGTAVRIDDRFHLDRLARIDRDAVVAKAAEWECPASFIGQPEWGIWEWHDAQATGSRIRLWFPRNHASPDCPDLPADPPEGRGLCRQDELASFAEPQLEGGDRTQVLVRGMFVPENGPAREALGMAPSVGSRVWVDLRGDAAPRLTADRKTMLAPEGGEWRAGILELFRRAGQALDHAMGRASVSVRRNTAYELLRKDAPAPPQTNMQVISMTTACET
jgi:hypothetical protein